MALAKSILFHIHRDQNGSLCAYEGGQTVPFEIKRVFTISAKFGDVRGNHAHKECSQLLVCVSGRISVDCDDGHMVENFQLNSTGIGLLIPPCVWAKQEYLEDRSVLMVLCDRIYEADDYLRTYDEFKKHIGN